jgi:hypothetical protein
MLKHESKVPGYGYGYYETLLDSNVTLRPSSPSSCPSIHLMWQSFRAMTLASNPIYHARTKHIEVDYHFIREKVLNKDFTLGFISTCDQPTDIFTKDLTSSRFQLLYDKLMVCPPPICLRGWRCQSSWSCSRTILSKIAWLACKHTRKEYSGNNHAVKAIQILKIFGQSSRLGNFSIVVVFHVNLMCI